MLDSRRPGESRSQTWQGLVVSPRRQTKKTCLLPWQPPYLPLELGLQMTYLSKLTSTFNFLPCRSHRNATRCPVTSNTGWKPSDFAVSSLSRTTWVLESSKNSHRQSATLSDLPSVSSLWQGRCRSQIFRNTFDTIDAHNAVIFRSRCCPSLSSFSPFLLYFGWVFNQAFLCGYCAMPRRGQKCSLALN